MSSTVFELVETLRVSIDQLNQVLMGNEAQTVTIGGVTKPSLSKAIADAFSAIQAAVQGRQPFATKADMNANLNFPANTLAEVWNDPTSANNGLYGKVGASGAGSWAKSPYDWLQTALNEVAALSTSVDSRIIEQFITTNDVMGIVDAKGYAVALVQSDGTVKVLKLNAPTATLGDATISKLSHTSADTYEAGLSLGYEYAITDQFGNVIFGVPSARAAAILAGAEYTKQDEVTGTYEQAWTDANGNVVFALMKDGTVLIPKLHPNSDGGSGAAVTDVWGVLSPSTTDTVIIIGDSHTASHYTLKDKAYVCNLSALDDYRFRNFGVSGNDALDMNYRIIQLSAYFDSASFRQMRPKYAFIVTHDNDGQFITADLTYWQENVCRLVETVRAHGCEPIICTEFNSTSTERAALKAVADRYGLRFVDNASLNYELGTLDVGPFHQGHPGTRTNGVLWLQMHEVARRLPKPDKALKVFRRRPTFAASSAADLLYKSRVERLKKFKELSITHKRLSDSTVQYFDELNGPNVYTHVDTMDEYKSLESGLAVSFADYALVEAILPGTAHSLDEVRVLVNASAGTEVFVRDYLDQAASLPGRAQGITPTSPDYVSKWNKPRGAWRSLGPINQVVSLLKDALPACMSGDRISLLLYRAGGFDLTKIEVSYRGIGGKHPKLALPALRTNGVELLTKTTLAGPDMASWITQGSTVNVVPIDNYNSPRLPSNLNNPVAGVAIISDVNTVAQVATVVAGKAYRLVVWARYFPKAFLDNSVYNLDAAQVIDRSQPGITFDANSPITPDTADVRTLRLEYAFGTSFPANGGVEVEDFACLTWRGVEYVIEVPPAPLGGTSLIFRLSCPDGEVQLAKASLQEIV